MYAMPMKLLVVEDNPSIRDALVESLREEGYAVEHAPDGAEGVFKALTWDYDLVILDVMLPQKDGWQVLTEIRAQKATPVLMLTARDAVTDRVKGLDQGADDYLTKPFDLMELLARVRALLRRQHGGGNPKIVMGEIEIDTTRRTVTRSGQPVEMTAREYAILETLVQSRGAPVSRTYLYEHLYTEDEETLSNILDVYICRLRSKLGRDFIKTQRGHGYVVDTEKSTA